MTALKNQAIQTALLGDFKNAINLNKSLLEENPGDIDTLNRLALAYMLTGKIKDAKLTYEKVLIIDPLNPIALRNTKKLKEKGALKNGRGVVLSHINNNFLEQTGITKIIDLVNLAQPKLLQALRTGQDVTLSIKRLKIFVLAGDNQYIGCLPDDIGKRLIKFMKNGNQYQAYIKSADPHHVIIFIKEIKRAAKYKDLPSFALSQDNSLFDKNGKFKKTVSKENKEEPETDEEIQEEEDL